MLRWEMGNEQFFKGLKSYLTDPTIANGFASQAKLVKHLETAAGKYFTEFFNDWYYGEGYPTYRITVYTDYADLGKAKIRVNQVSSHPSVSFFEMHLPIRVWKGGKYKDLRLYNTMKNQEFVISETKVDSIRFDPDKWLCDKSYIVVPGLEVLKPDQIQIIPDYSTKRIRIILPEFSGKEIFRIFDLSGRIASSGLLTGQDSQIEINSLKNGVYLIEIQIENRKKVEKIIVNN